MAVRCGVLVLAVAVTVSGVRPQAASRLADDGDRALADPAAPRAGAVEATLTDGRVVRHLTRHPPGTKENPLRLAQVADKARGLMAPVLGEQVANAVISRVNAIEGERDLRDLVRLMRGGA